MESDPDNEIEGEVIDAGAAATWRLVRTPAPALRGPTLALVRVEDFEFPELAPPDPTIPTEFPKRIISSQPPRTRETRRGDCVERQTVQFLRLRGPTQTKDQHVLDIVVVEPTGSSGGTSIGTSIASVDAIYATYFVVLLKICVRYRWQLWAIAKRTTTELRCPPPAASTTSVSDEIKSARWVQIEELFPLPCERTVLFTTGAHAQSYEEAVRWANTYAGSAGLDRGIGTLQDHR